MSFVALLACHQKGIAFVYVPLLFRTAKPPWLINPNSPHKVQVMFWNGNRPSLLTIGNWGNPLHFINISSQNSYRCTTSLLYAIWFLQQLDKEASGRLLLVATPTHWFCNYNSLSFHVIALISFLLADLPVLQVINNQQQLSKLVPCVRQHLAAIAAPGNAVVVVGLGMGWAVEKTSAWRIYESQP